MDLKQSLLSFNNEEEPFEGLVLSEDWIKLRNLDGRTSCHICKKSRKYFCYTCLTAVPEVQPYVPKVKLPLKVDIIKHCQEIDGKSTAIHAAILAPEEVTIYTYPCIPNYNNEERVILVFPSDDSVCVEDAVQISVSENGPSSAINKVVFIDSTWHQCKSIFNDPRISNLPTVILKSRFSMFWRHQKGSPRWHLATIEAIHQFFVEYKFATSKCDSSELNENSKDSTLYHGEYDNLLFFFRFMYDKIHDIYEHDDLLSYKRPKV